jgi:PAS domain S-box-containing protein
MTQKPTYKELEQKVEALEKENASLTKEKERAVNITERNLAEKAMRESEKLYRRILQTATDGFWLLDLDGCLLDVNDAYCTMSGYSKEELLSMRVSDLEASESHEEVSVHIKKIIDQSGDRFETRQRRKDGSILDVEISVQFQPGGKGLLFVFVRDITERKQAEDEREKLQVQLSNALEIANLAPWEYDVVEDLFTLNDHFYRLFRTTAEEVGGYVISHEEYARRFVHPDDIDHFKKRMQEPSEGPGQNFKERMERRVIFADGTVGYLSINLLSIKDNQGKTVRIYGASQDITERKRAEEKQKNLQAQLVNAIEMAHLGPWEYDVANDLFLFNDHFYKIFHTTAEEVGGYSISSEEYAQRFLHPDDIPLVGEEVRKAIETTDPNFSRQMEHRILYADGTVGWITVRFNIIKDENGQTVRTYGANQDITERKQAEIEREKLQAQLSNALEIANLAPWEYDVAEDLFTLNDHFYRLFRTTAEEVRGYTMSSEEHARRFVHPDDSQGPLKEIIESIDSDSGLRKEHRAVHGDGTVGYKSVKMFVARDSHGKAVRAYGVNQDITESKQAEMEREKLQALLSNAVEIANLAPWEYNVAEDLFTFNDIFYKVFRTTADEVGGYTMSSGEFAQRFFHPDEVRTFEERLHESDEGRDLYSGQRVENRIIYGDGTHGYISVIPCDVKDSQGKTIHIYGVNQDITEQKRMEEELLRAQKLESVGILAGGIAHDFNNILTTILGSIALAKMDVGPKDEIFPLLSDVETASSRAQALTKQLLTFSKGGAPIKETSSVKEVITESSIFVLRGSKSSGEFSIAEDLWPVEVDVGQISQVINNVVMNANQAMPEGGKIQVTGENLTIEDTHGLPIKPGRYVRISIRDQGLGIAKEDIEKVFDPFFTTKHEGSGLGLATTYSIVKNHDGHITVESELGKSTTFQIYLPASEKAIQGMAEDRVIPGTGKILIMDDEAFVRKTLGRILERLGYEPEFAEEGAEAIEMYKTAEESGKPYEAVILDLTIPGGMGGKETVKKLLEMKSGAKAIVSSGYSDDSLLANFQEYGFRGILPKPFDPQAVSKVLNEVIQGKAGLRD